MNKIPISRGFTPGKIFLTMKFIVIFMLLGISNAFAVSYGQNEKITVKVHNATLKEVVSTIEDQSDYVFFYKSEEVSNLQRFNLNVSEKTVREILDMLVQNSSLTYKISNQYIYLNKKEKTIETIPQQQRGIVVKGLVLDPDGNPLPGATITVIGSTKGVITDSEGVYSIEVKPTDQLLFSFIGMESQTIKIENRTTINVVLKEKVDELEEVTIVAFAKQKKESVIGGITTVKPAELKIPSSNLTTALAGRLAGVISYQRSGEPGEDNANFFIRGVTTFGYKVDPLILIDGVELTTNDLARLQPDDIQSFSIMKDATATALYGARGANGVILVTTKEGTEGKAKISVRLENSFSSPTKKLELADPITYMRLHNEAVLTRNPLGNLPYSEDKIVNTIAGTNKYVYPATDWYREIIKNNTTNQRLNFNISGGGKVAKYYLAASVTQDNGVLNVDKRNNFNSNIDLKRYLLRSNININLTNTTEAVIRVHGTFDDYTGPIDGGAGIYNKIMRTNPVLFPAYYEPDAANKYTNHILFGNYGDKFDYINPYADLVKGYKDYRQSMILIQFELRQNLDFIIKGLRGRFLMNTNRSSYFDVSRFYNPFYYNIGYYDRVENTYELDALNANSGTEYLGYNEGTKKVSTNNYIEAAVQYDRTLADKHGISGLLVFTRRESLEGNAGDLQQSLPYRNLGLSGRCTYSYASRYFIEANFGYNGSERFNEKHRFGFFPSAGVAWVISKEDFWKSLSNTVNKLKLKATYGLVGNDAIGSASDRFYYLSNVNMNNSGKGYQFGYNFDYSRNGISISRYADPTITWETSYKGNLGLEMGLFNKIEIQTDLFHEYRTNILMPRASIPTTMGLQSKLKSNIGEAASSGIDISIDYNTNIGKNVWIVGRGNFTYASSEFKVYEEPDYSETPWMSRVGSNLSQKWGYVAERLFVDDKEVSNSPLQTFGEYAGGDIKYKDINKDGIINELDQVPIGYPTVPKIMYGFGVSAGYKSWDISVFFQGSAMSSFWIDATNTAPFADTDENSSTHSNNALLDVYAQNHWSEANQDVYALWPRLSDHVINNNTQASTWFMRDGSFLRLKSVEFGYSVSKDYLRRIGASQFRIYFSGTNLLTLSKFKLWDPEMAGNGLGYPVQKVVNLGLQISF